MPNLKQCLPSASGTRQSVVCAGHQQARQGTARQEQSAEPTRRHSLEQMAALAAAFALPQPVQAASYAPSERRFTLEDVTPQVKPPEPLSSREEAVIQVFEQTAPAVVNVFDATLPFQGKPATSVDTPEGNGTGFIWDDAGHLVTNYHVIGSAISRLGQQRPGNQPPKVARISLLGPDGFNHQYDGFLIGADKTRDLAVLRISAPKEQLKPVRVGQSSSLRVGQQCLALGNPFGFDLSLTTGVVSGLGREIASIPGSLITNAIQTDTAINPGNSGGPLLNSAGQVIGVNTAAFSQTGTWTGVGFAIPVDAVSRVVPQLIQNGRVSQPSLKIQVASDQVARSLRVTQGALVQSVPAGTPAAAAGLQGIRRSLTGITPGDVVVGLNGRPITKGSELNAALDGLSEGSTVSMDVQRGDQRIQLQIPLDS